jgi:hypothetical protein
MKQITKCEEKRTNRYCSMGFVFLNQVDLKIIMSFSVLLAA